ncbi:MAG: hypothetical protein LC649_10030 [Bacteroidales bacterium]|nr:hypothetical protein [Bacteroidales bacterium]
MVESVKKASEKLFSAMGGPYDSETVNRFKAIGDENADKIWQTDPVLMVGNIGITDNQSDMWDMLDRIIENRIATPNTILESHYSVLSKDKVLDVTKFEYYVTLKDSTVGPPLIGVQTTLWANINGEWKTQYHHQSWERKPE